MDTETVSKTIKKFIDRPFLFQCKANCISASNQGLIFDCTIFHPFGGGQPGSRGSVKFDSLDPQLIFPVVDTTYHPINNQQILHKINIPEPEDESETSAIPDSGINFDSMIGKSAVLSIDRDQRVFDSRLHSAGHLLDIALFKISPQFSISLKPSKGNHFPNNPYVEYKGLIPADQRENVKKALNNQLETYFVNPKYFPDSMIQQKLVSSVQEIAKHCQGECSPVFKENGKYFGQPCRILIYDDYGCPCSGTHVEYFGQISNVNISKIQKKGKNMRISYNLDPSLTWIKDTFTFSVAKASQLDRIAELEQLGFPEDEAAEKPSIQKRLEEAPDFFWVGEAYGRVLGFINGTKFFGTTLGHETMSTHDPKGNCLAIHSVVTDNTFKRRGIGSAMISAYIAHVSQMAPEIRPQKIVLICHQYLIDFYSSVGFKMIGPSSVVHGGRPWFEMAIDV